MALALASLMERKGIKLMRGTRDVSAFRLYGPDGEVGSIQDLTFDNRSWAVRYFIVKTGEWCSGRIVLIAPFAVVEISDAHAAMHINLRNEQIAQAPPLDTTKLISRRYEEDYYQYYQQEPYWQTDTTMGASPTCYPDTSVMILNKPLLPKPLRPPCLYHAGEMIGYEIRARDGDVGQLRDLLMEKDWGLPYVEVLVETRNGSSTTVLVETRRIEQIDHQRRSLGMSLTRHAVQSAPAYDTAESITLDYQMDLSQHYRKVA